MNIISLQPTDTLFFRDGRPMGGASSGHGTAWPMPGVISHAFHAALHRAAFDGAHKHVPGRSSLQRDFSETNRMDNGRLFGSLVTAGPFPVQAADDHGRPIEPKWFFPRPLDAAKADSPQVTLRPSTLIGDSSLPPLLIHAPASGEAPTKEKPAPWWSQAAWKAYLTNPSNQTDPPDPSHYLQDSAFSDTEHSYGIGISAETGTAVEGQFYSAHYLRLRPHWRLGTLALAEDKEFEDPVHGKDLVQALLNGHGTEIIIGGQQRICTATLLHKHGHTLPFPVAAANSGTRVKWVLLTPAIFPEIKANPAKGINAHAGGWLPNWIDPQTGVVLLKSGALTRRDRETREAWRARVRQAEPIAAKLVAAITGKPVPVSGYALPNSADPDRTEGGAKSTHLTVQAGAVYYFEADSPEEAQTLAAALNWHGSDTAPTTIRNRRSTLMGEKGFGLGVCGNWDFHQTRLDNPKSLS